MNGQSGTIALPVSLFPAFSECQSYTTRESASSIHTQQYSCPGRPAVEITRQVNVDIKTGEVDIPSEAQYASLFVASKYNAYVANYLVNFYPGVNPGVTLFDILRMDVASLWAQRHNSLRSAHIRFPGLVVGDYFILRQGVGESFTILAFIGRYSV